MTYKAAKNINLNFSLDERNQAILTVNKMPITNGMDRGYVYAALFLYDEAKKEIDKLVAMINKIIDDINTEVHYDDPSKMLMELTTRVRRSIGDDSLDALIKEILAEKSGNTAITLMPLEAEQKKYEKVKEDIFLELFTNFFETTVLNAKTVGNFKTVKFTREYINSLTPRQRHLIAPAMKLVGFINSVRLDNLEILEDWSALFATSKLQQDFEKEEVEIKNRLKKMIQEATGE